MRFFSNNFCNTIPFWDICLFVKNRYNLSNYFFMKIVTFGAITFFTKDRGCGWPDRGFSSESRGEVRLATAIGVLVGDIDGRGYTLGVFRRVNHWNQGTLHWWSTQQRRRRAILYGCACLCPFVTLDRVERGVRRP